MMRSILLAVAALACGKHEDPAPTKPPAAPPAPPADAEPDARVVAPKSAAAPLACPAGAKQVTRARSSHEIAGPLVTEIACIGANDQEDGPSLLYDDDGNLAEEATYKAGHLDGAFVSYRNGVKYQTGQYKDGAMTGTWTTLYPSGAKDCVSERDDATTIELHCYNEKGQLTVRGKSPHGKNEGLWEWFHHDDGTPSAAVLYKDGTEVKWWVWKNGKKVASTADEVTKVSDYAKPPH